MFSSGDFSTFSRHYSSVQQADNDPFQQSCIVFHTFVVAWMCLWRSQSLPLMYSKHLLFDSHIFSPVGPSSNVQSILTTYTHSDWRSAALTGCHGELTQKCRSWCTNCSSITAANENVAAAAVISLMVVMLIELLLSSGGNAGLVCATKTNEP